MNCTGLIEVIIPDKVTKIGDEAFRGCDSLKKVLIPKTTINIGKDTFVGCPNLIVYGFSNSYAEEYAQNNQLWFSAIS